MADFDLFKIKVIDRYSLFLEKGLILANRRRLTYSASKSIQSFWLHPHQRAQKVKKKNKRKKEKKDEPLNVGYMYLRPQKFFRNQILLYYLGR